MEIFGDTLMFGSVRSAPDDIDLGDLEVKTGQDAIFAISEVMERQRREVEERRAHEEGRCSEPRREVAADGVVWEYVVVDDAFARITGCALPDDGMRELVVPGELGGLAVLELGAGACEMLEGVERAVCADCIEAIGPSAFRMCRDLRVLVLPRMTTRFDSSWINQCRKLEELVLPGMLERVDPEVFEVGELARLTIGVGTTSVEPGAFANSRLAEVHVASGNPFLATDCISVFERVRVGDDATLVIENGGPLWLDGHGVLYANEGPIRVVVGAMDPNLVEYDVATGCEAICERAFANMPRLQRVALPEGLAEIGDGAFRGCRSLRQVRFPETLRSIGDEAFLDTALEGVYLSANFEHLGELALATAGTRDLNGAPTLTDVRVNPNCARFYHTGGLLCERVDGGTSRVILYDGSRSDVVIPREVDTLAPFSFGNATNLAALSIGTNVRHIQTRALNVNCLIEHVHVDFVEPIEDHSCVDLHFPVTFRSLNEIVRGFNSMTYLNPEALLARYDACVVNMHDYDAKSMAPIDLYGQLTRIIGRLRDPLFLSENTRRMYGQILRENLVEMCVAAARHDDRESVDALVELGYLNRETLLPVIDAVGALQDAAMTGYLLELQRALAGRGLDFEL